MKNRNLMLFMVLTVVVLLAHQWFMAKYYPAPKTPAQVVQVTPAPAVAPSPAPVPAVPAVATAVKPSGARHTASRGGLRLTWDASTGALVQAELLDYKISLEDPAPVRLMPATFPGLGAAFGTTFDKVSDEVTPKGLAVHFENATGEHLTYRMPDSGSELLVEWTSPRGAHLIVLPAPQDDDQVKDLTKLYTLDEKGLKDLSWSSYLHDSFFGLSKRKPLPAATPHLGMDAGPVQRARNLYFAALWDLGQRVPEKDGLGYHLGPDAQGKLTARLYLGPKLGAPLEAFGPIYKQVLDFGFFGKVAKGLFWVLSLLHALIRNWGWTIIVFTLLLRVALWPLNTKQTVSMLRMKDFEPHQKALQAKYEKFGSDMTKKAEMQKELMELYKKNGHNPLGGCLPALLQMPVLFALYSVLLNVFDLRQAPFAGYLMDLSVKDPHYILPVLLGVSMLVQQAVTPTVGDPQQKKMMMFMMPAMMVFIFAQLPAGLNLYYVTFNLLGLVQTWWVIRNYVPQPIKV